MQIQNTKIPTNYVLSQTVLKYTGMNDEVAVLLFRTASF